jgi:hypothetical protein
VKGLVSWWIVLASCLLCAAPGQRVVLGEIARSRLAAAEQGLDAIDRLRGDVLVECAGRGTRLQDARDGVVIERAEGSRVMERGDQIVTAVALTEREDLSCVTVRPTERRKASVEGGA